jgi:hypothetical protein
VNSSHPVHPFVASGPFPASETRCWNRKESLTNSNSRYACANGFVVLTEGLDMCMLWTANGGNMNPSGNTKRTVVGLCDLGT